MKEKEEKKYKEIVFEKVNSEELTIGKAVHLYEDIRVHSECNAANKIILLSLSIEDLD
ncbi:MAG: hypothetical protein PHU82_00895 [Candidatus Pacebacteria bacterium]|jgi:hypothetical protein|nr:hypothetical protein [Candidatus Paceibacterota bacterium]MDD4994570.1 hypothetical protein [Candidatus Paceibacterota bacterium]MDD5535196.1 hypothetical protein [Candidatus Paceibacterota bacterium]